MESVGVISPVDTPTPWCAGMVVVPKTSGNIHICVDLKPLNVSVLRDAPTSKSGRNSGLADGCKNVQQARRQQQLLANSSSRTVLPPFNVHHPQGRYCFNKLLFGISSAPEHFQKRMSSILNGIEGVLWQMDDVQCSAKISLSMIGDSSQHLNAFKQQSNVEPR